MLGKFRCAAGISLAFGMLVGISNAHADASDQQAYEAAMKCYVLAGHSAAERKRAGDDEKATLYESKAHASFDLAVKFGRSAGYKGQTIEADILETQERELPKFVRDENYVRQSATVCRALGLL